MRTIDASMAQLDTCPKVVESAGKQKKIAFVNQGVLSPSGSYDSLLLQVLSIVEQGEHPVDS